MFNTSIIDVALGMVFIYLLLSLLCTATNELIELFLKKRASDLEKGIRELLQPGTEPGEGGIVEDIYNHPLVNGLFDGKYEESGIKSGLPAFTRTYLPSYIPARNFALALMDTILRPYGATSPPEFSPSSGSPPEDSGADRLAMLRTQLQSFDPRLEQALTPLIDAAAGDVARARANIEDWYNSSMDRVSGWYKRRSHIIVLVLGFLIAVTLNADSVLMVRRLASDRALRDSLVSSANLHAQQAATNPAAGPMDSFTKKCTEICTDETPQCRLKKTQCEIGGLGLPLGWSSQSDERLRWDSTDRFLNEHVPNHLFGWLLTALAISLGAPFWFDLLNKFIVIRSTVKPKEKSPEDKSKD